jgi:hypothetical protein
MGTFELCEGEPPGGAALLGDGVAGEIYCYRLMVRGAVSLKLSVDSAGRTISFSPV